MADQGETAKVRLQSVSEPSQEQYSHDELDVIEREKGRLGDLPPPARVNISRT